MINNYEKNNKRRFSIYLNEEKSKPLIFLYTLLQGLFFVSMIHILGRTENSFCPVSEEAGIFRLTFTQILSIWVINVTMEVFLKKTPVFVSLLLQDLMISLLILFLMGTYSHANYGISIHFVLSVLYRQNFWLSRVIPSYFLRIAIFVCFLWIPYCVPLPGVFTYELFEFRKKIDLLYPRSNLTSSSYDVLMERTNLISRNPKYMSIILQMESFQILCELMFVVNFFFFTVVHKYFTSLEEYELEEELEKFNSSKRDEFSFVCRISHFTRTSLNVAINFLHFLEEHEKEKEEELLLLNNYPKKKIFMNKSIIMKGRENYFIENKRDYSILRKCCSIITFKMLGLVEYYKIMQAGDSKDKSLIPINITRNVNIRKIIEETLRIHISTSFKSLETVSIITKVSKRIPPFLDIDEHLFITILSNVFSNSLKYCEKGRITNEFEFISLPCPNKSKSKKEENEGKEMEFFLRVTIKDTGIGIEKSKIKDIFTPYKEISNQKNMEFQKPSFSIGMVIVKKSIDRLNGDIKIFSEGKGKGTKVTFQFPVKISVITKSELDYNKKLKKKKKDENNNNNNLCQSVIIVDDNILNISVMKFQVENILTLMESENKIKKWKIYTAEDGIQGLKVLGRVLRKENNNSKFKKKYSDLKIMPPIVITDINMPHLDGLGMCKKIREFTENSNSLFQRRRGNKFYPKFVVHAITGTVIIDKERYIRKYEFDGFSSKPVKYDEMKLIVEESIELNLRRFKELEEHIKILKHISNVEDKKNKIKNDDNSNNNNNNKSIKLEEEEEDYDGLGFEENERNEALRHIFKKKTIVEDSKFKIIVDMLQGIFIILIDAFIFWVVPEHRKKEGKALLSVIVFSTIIQYVIAFFIYRWKNNYYLNHYVLKHVQVNQYTGRARKTGKGKMNNNNNNSNITLTEEIDHEQMINDNIKDMKISEIMTLFAFLRFAVYMVLGAEYSFLKEIFSLYLCCSVNQIQWILSFNSFSFTFVTSISFFLVCSIYTYLKTNTVNHFQSYFIFQNFIVDYSNEEEKMMIYDDISFNIVSEFGATLYLTLICIFFSYSHVKIKESRTEKWKKMFQSTKEIERNHDLTISQISHDLIPPTSSMVYFVKNIFKNREIIFSGQYEKKYKEMEKYILKSLNDLDNAMKNFIICCKMKQNKVKKLRTSEVSVSTISSNLKEFINCLNYCIQKERKIKKNKNKNNNGSKCFKIIERYYVIERNRDGKIENKRKMMETEKNTCFSIDRKKVDLILSNLLSNSMFHSNGKRILLEFSMEKYYKHKRGKKRRKRLRCVIEDNGIGIHNLEEVRKECKEFVGIRAKTKGGTGPGEKGMRKIENTLRLSNTLGFGLRVSSYLSSFLEGGRLYFFDNSTTPKQGSKKVFSTGLRNEFICDIFKPKKKNMKNKNSVSSLLNSGSNKTNNNNNIVNNETISSKKNTKVLVLDDSVIITAFVFKYLKDILLIPEQNIFCKNKVDEALDILKKGNEIGKIDIFLCDMFLGVTTGFKIGKMLLKKKNNRFVKPNFMVLMSANDDVLKKEKQILEVFDDVLAKPILPDVILNKFQSLML